MFARLARQVMKSVHRPLLGLLLLLSLMSLLMGVFLYRDWKDKEAQYLGQQGVELDTAYRSSVKMYAIATDLLFKEITQHAEVVDAIRVGSNEKDEDLRAQARGKLYMLLYPTYAQLKLNNMRQFHFHLPNGESFLRFHEPSKFGDPLFDVRPSVRIANTEHRVVTGFETGRVLSGFRYVYPIEADGQHLGSMEASVSFRAIREAMAHLEKTREYGFLLRRTAVDGLMAPEQMSLYGPARLHADYLIEDPELTLPDSPPPPSPLVQALNTQLAEMPEVITGMREGKTMVLKVVHQDKTWAAAFLPVRDVLNRQVAYVVSYSEAPLANLFRRDFIASLSITLLFFVAVGVMFAGLLRSRAALKAEKQSLKIITDTVADGLYAMDKNGRLTLLNPSAEMLLGFREKDVLGKVGHDLFHSHAVNENVPKERCPIYRRVSQGRAFDGEEHFVNRDGGLLPVEVASRPILEHGEIGGSVTVFRDITKRKRMEAALTEAVESAENANRLKSEFLANMSHEIRTPMNGIMGLTQLTLDSDLTEDQRDQLEMVKKSADTLMTIINDILDFSKIEAGRLTIEHTPFPLGLTLRTALQPLEHQAQQKGLRLILTRDEAVPERLLGDPVRLTQVLTNLVGNAIKFTEQGEIEVRVGFNQEDPESERIFFCVRDTGTGIPPEKLDSIFDSFSQVDASITRRFGGTGLGLTIVRHLVNLMGGEVNVESTPGQGSRFYFSLPLETDPNAQHATEARPAHAPAENNDGPLNVLLVEDNAVNRKLATTLLAKAGHTFGVAEDGGEAVAVLTAPHNYDVVLLDVQMPVMDGLQVAEAVRLHESLYGGHVHIIALTANAMVGDRERFLAAGMDDYVSKPIQVAVLHEALAKVPRG